MIEALKQMVEALEYHIEQTRPISKTKEAIQAGKKAIEELESQKPVAWLVEFENGEQELHFDEQSVGEIHTPLYSIPFAPQRTWVSLSMEQFEHFTSYVRADVLIEIEEAFMENNT